MGEVSITINGRHYDISCDTGQEGRIIDLAGYIDQQIGKVSQTGAAYNDSHLQILTLLVVADQLFEAQETRQSVQALNPAEQPVPDVQIKKIEKMVRDEIQAEYAERLNTLQAQLANSNQRVKAAESKESKNPASDDAKDTLKILKHLNERVTGLMARVDAL